MDWNFSGDRPVYLQLLERMELAIASGYYDPGQRLPSVRELAQLCRVNPNTAQRALSALEEEGLVSTQRTSGKFVTADPGLIERTRRQFAQTAADAYLRQMEGLGYGRDEAAALLAQKAAEKTDMQEGTP